MRYLFFICLSLTPLVACSSRTVTLPEQGVSDVQVILVSTDFAVGQPRVSFALFDGPEAASGIQAIGLRAFLLQEDETVPVWQGEAVNYSDYGIPYWVAYPDLPQPGFVGMEATITRDDGTTTTGTFTLQVEEKSKGPALGSQAPASENRTLRSEPDITRLSSGSDPNPDLYQLTIAEAIETGHPTVVGFLTPGLCQTQFCAPVLESVETVRDDVGTAANFIHVEVYADFQSLTLVPEMAEWGLDTEPWVFVLDDNGRVAASFSGPLSPRELDQALTRVLR